MGLKARELALSRYTSEHAVGDWIGFLGAIAPAAILATAKVTDTRAAPETKVCHAPVRFGP
jgi:hypothetical protein